MKKIGMFVGKSVAFSFLFWIVGASLFFTMNNLGQRSPATVTSNTYGDMTKEYWRQARETDDLQKTTRRQLAQSAEIIKKQSELLERWEKIIESWEQNAPK